MSADVILMCFLGVATIFLYSEKMKLAPPSGKLLLAWRLVYFGAALAFFVCAAFFYSATRLPEGSAIRLIVLVFLLLSALVVFFGFILFFLSPKHEN